MVRPELGIALLRVVVGAWFLKAVWTKVTIEWLAGVIPYPAPAPAFLARFPKLVAGFAAGNPKIPEQAAGNPIGWYKDFLEGLVLPHAKLWATLQAYGEVVVGVLLVVGLFTGLGALVGLVLTANYGLATQWMTVGQQGFHVLLVTSMVILLLTRAGRAWGLDALIMGRRAAGRSRLLRFLA